VIPNATRKARVIAVTSGKGGVGKTNVSVNLSVALARLGRRAMLVDCDVGLANANILLGLDTGRTLADLTLGERSVAEIGCKGPAGMVLVPGHSGTGLGGALGAEARRELAAALRPYADEADDVIVDTGGGLADDALSLVAASDMILVVLADEPTAFMDAYATVKALTLRHGCAHFTIVANRARSSAEGRALFDRFDRVVTQFLPVHLDYAGSIPDDPYLRDAVLAKKCCVEAFPSSPAARAFGRIARRIAAAEIPLLPGGQLFFGMEAVHGAH
jgi:flagellar biosynthesis protein FlhG